MLYGLSLTGGDLQVPVGPPGRRGCSPAGPLTSFSVWHPPETECVIFSVHVGGEQGQGVWTREPRGRFEVTLKFATLR